MAGTMAVFRKAPFVEVGNFESTIRSLDFPSEMDVRLPGKAWAINVPGWDLKKRRLSGIGGPGGSPLFHPPSAATRLSRICGVYDEWRPYPAQPPLSNYAREIATRIARKRAKALRLVSSSLPWDFILACDHAPASVAHLDKGEACRVASVMIDSALEVVAAWPDAALVILGPYGVGNEDGFVVSNRMEPSVIGNWEQIRRYARGESIRPIGLEPA